MNAPVTGAVLDVLGLEVLGLEVLGLELLEDLLVLVTTLLLVVTALLLDVLTLLVDVADVVTTELLEVPLGSGKKLATKLKLVFWLTRLPSSTCLLYTSPSPRDRQKSRMPSSA